MRLVVIINSGGSSNYFPPGGGIQSSNILDALKELDAEKASRQFVSTFAQNNLTVNNIFIANHNLNLIPGNVTVWDNTNQRVNPDNISTIDENYVSIDLSSYAPLVGIYKVVVSE